MEDLIKGELDWHNKVNENFHEVDSQMAEKAKQADVDTIKQQQVVQARNTFGTYANATVKSVIANRGDNPIPEVMGITLENDNQLAEYDNRDSVALYGSNSNANPLTVSTVTYTANSVTVPLATDLSSAKIGMIIDTLHATKYSGIITAINDNVISVNNWYQMGNTDKGQIPSNDFGIKINSATKIWFLNGNIFINASGAVTSASIMELGMFLNRVSTGDTNGIDLPSMGTNSPDYGIRVRSTNSNNRWTQGFNAHKSKNAFVSDNSNTAEKLLLNTDSGFYITNSGTHNKLKLQFGTSSQTTNIDGNATPLFIISNVTNHTIANPSTNIGNIIFIYNATSSNVNLLGSFANPTTVGSYTLPSKNGVILFSDGANWYNF